MPILSRRLLSRCLLPIVVLLHGGVVHGSNQAQGLRALRIDAASLPRIDGDLNDDVWRSAPLYDSFHKHQPRDGAPTLTALNTTVQLLVDDGALVFGIRAWDDAPELRRATLARRDKVNVDQDFIGIWIDPAGHGRAAQFVRINTSGVVSDGMHRASDDESDLGPDFPIETAVKILPDGYSMEVRWPLSNLRFPYRDGRNWRVMVERSIPHADGTLLITAPYRIDALSHLSFLQEIEGMDATVRAVRDRSFVELRPELTIRRERMAVPGARSHGQQAELGMEINVRPRADWVFNATLNPDYSQVEIDEPVLQGAGNIALSLPEKRGFFLESADVLGLPLPAFYSRTINDPEYGLRATWRAAQFDATAMSLRDEPGGLVLRGRPYETQEYVQTRRTVASLARARWHGDGLLVGAFASQRSAIITVSAATTYSVLMPNGGAKAAMACSTSCPGWRWRRARASASVKTRTMRRCGWRRVRAATCGPSICTSRRAGGMSSKPRRSRRASSTTMASYRRPAWPV